MGGSWAAWRAATSYAADRAASARRGAGRARWRVSELVSWVRPGDWKSRAGKARSRPPPTGRGNDRFLAQSAEADFAPCQPVTSSRLGAPKSTPLPRLVDQPLVESLVPRAAFAIAAAGVGVREDGAAGGRIGG